MVYKFLKFLVGETDSQNVGILIVLHLIVEKLIFGISYHDLIFLLLHFVLTPLWPLFKQYKYICLKIT